MFAKLWLKTKTTVQCQVVGITETNPIFCKEKYRFHIWSISTPFSHIETRTNCKLYGQYHYYCYCYGLAALHHRAVFIPACCYFNILFNRKQMVALFRLSPIQLTHCNLLLYNRLVRVNVSAFDTCSRIRGLCECACIYWNVVTSIKLSEV